MYIRSNQQYSPIAHRKTYKRSSEIKWTNFHCLKYEIFTSKINSENPNTINYSVLIYTAENDMYNMRAAVQSDTSKVKKYYSRKLRVFERNEGNKRLEKV